LPGRRPRPVRGDAHAPVDRAGGLNDRHVAELVAARRPRNLAAAAFAAALNAGTVDDHIGRFRELAEAGVGEVMVRLPDLADPGALTRMAKVIAAFR
jgi:hypothetical protein